MGEVASSRSNKCVYYLPIKKKKKKRRRRDFMKSTNKFIDVQDRIINKVKNIL